MNPTKTVAIGTDERGAEVANHVLAILQATNSNLILTSATADQESLDTALVGSHDYPEEACRVANAVTNQTAETGILVSGSAIGMCITANKHPGIRAVVAYDEWVVRRSRAHHNCNILCIPAELASRSNLKNIIDIWLNTEFEAGRHERRINKIALVDQGETPTDHPINS